MLDRGDADATLRQRRKQWLVRDLAIVLASEASARLVLCDEGVIQRGISVANSYSDAAAVSERYFRMVPPPRAVVAIETPLGLIAKRITARGPHQAGHLRDLEATLVHVGTGLRILNERGTAIVAADGARLAVRDEVELSRIVQALRRVMAGTA